MKINNIGLFQTFVFFKKTKRIRKVESITESKKTL